MNPVPNAKTFKDCWCEPDCPHFQDQTEEVAKTCMLDPPARCKHLDCDLGFYDWWLAECLNK